MPQSKRGFFLRKETTLKIALYLLLFFVSMQGHSNINSAIAMGVNLF